MEHKLKDILSWKKRGENKEEEEEKFGKKEYETLKAIAFRVSTDMQKKIFYFLVAENNEIKKYCLRYKDIKCFHTSAPVPVGQAWIEELTEWDKRFVCSHWKRFKNLKSEENNLQNSVYSR